MFSVGADDVVDYLPAFAESGTRRFRGAAEDIARLLQRMQIETRILLIDGCGPYIRPVGAWSGIADDQRILRFAPRHTMVKPQNA
jgi:hypothetical protein